MKFLIFPAVPSDELDLINAGAGQCEVVNAASLSEAEAHIADADGFYGALTPELFAQAGKLRWVQAPVAGVEHFVFPALAESDVVFTNMAGIYSDVIADHALTYLLMFARGFHVYRTAQAEGVWDKNAPVRHLADCTVAVVGLGGIGAATAKRAKALETHVLGVEVRPIDKPEGVDELAGIEDLDDVLQRADFVILCVPHTPETVNLITARELNLMKPSAYLINICRGVVVNLDDLTQALQAERIAGAGLDVFAIEPLPESHPLWGMENVIITPHVAARGPHIRERHIRVVADNLARFAAGRPLHNVTDKRRWFLAH